MDVAPRSSINTLSNGKVAKFDAYLRDELNSLLWNINNDWDFVLLVSGDGMVRTGKSVLALNVGAYLADNMGTPFTLKSNVFFEGKLMMEAAKNAPPNSVFIYDEAREGLATAKRFKEIQEKLIDFFNECGQLNHVFILVLPDFFGLHWELATNRSELLLNVYRTANPGERYLNKADRLKGFKSPVTIFKRGQFEFYSRRRKQTLYWKSKRSGLRQYNLGKPNFVGSFSNNYPVDEQEYRAMKRDALLRFTEEKEKSKPVDIFRNKIIIELKEKGMSGEQIRRHFNNKFDGYDLSAQQINKIYRESKVE